MIIRIVTFEPSQDDIDRWGSRTLACLHPDDAAMIEAMPTHEEWAAAFGAASNAVYDAKQERENG